MDGVGSARVNGSGDESEDDEGSGGVHDCRWGAT